MADAVQLLASSGTRSNLDDLDSGGEPPTDCRLQEGQDLGASELLLYACAKGIINKYLHAELKN